MYDLKDKWTIGPKFREYFLLNFRMVRLQLLGTAVLSLTAVTRPLAFLLLPSILVKLYSTTLYHQQASLYQSVPVSAFETALTKILIGSIGAAFPVVLYLGGWTPLQIVQNLVLDFLLCNIILLGISVGNYLRDTRAKRPNAALALLVIAGLLLMVWGIQWVFTRVTLPNPVVLTWIGLGLSIIGTAVMFWLNVRALERWYSI